MNTKLNLRKFENDSLEDIRMAATQARAEYFAALIHSAWRGLQRAGQWLAQHAAAAPGSRQSRRGCTDCP